ncbi:MAG: sigma-70 family RNA polymerase sigma factor [Myxococcales bacterium]|nr:sigma-70 family RNA polymerase sigma factor [Myxococcales bacterium]
MTAEREHLERDVRAACDRGDHAAAVALIVRGYGGEVGAYLDSIVRATPDDAAETFSLWCEDLVRGLPGFRFGASVRTWVYTLARHAAARRARGDGRRARRFPMPGELDEIVAQVRTATVEYLRTAVKDQLAEARASLSDDDRELLFLRVDRQLTWREIAVIMSGSDAAPEDEAVRKLDQALRKRFEAIKRRLKAKLDAG